MTDQSFTEAPASLNFYVVTAKGYNVQVTLRDSDEAHLMERFARLAQWLEEHRATPKPVGQQPRLPQPQPTDPEIPEPLMPPDAFDVLTPSASAPPQQPQAGEESFEAAELVGSMNAGTVYWKVKGGIFSKWGVTVWPEALKAAGLGEPDPAKVHPLTGYTAYFVRKDDGKPQKVTRLLKHS